MIRVLITKASDSRFHELKVFSTCEDMLKYLKEQNIQWVISFDDAEEYDIEAILYDYYIE